ncbi:hypothetical protein ACHQM5_003641 [Ranunculus cassubicifolius]
MAPKLEVLKSTGGSIRVGTTGTIGSLMSKELEKSAPQTPIPPRVNISTQSVSVPCGALNSPRKLQPKTTVNEASSSSSSSSNNNNNNGDTSDRQPEDTQKTKQRTTRKGTHHLPILTSDNAPIAITPNREKTERKGFNLVEVVDIKCGHPNKWSKNPITNRFKKLNSSSKLPETTV